MSERWKQVGELFHQVAALPAAEREAFLERAGAEDPQLAAEVRTMIEHAEQAGGFLSQPLSGLEAAPAAALPPGTRFGAWSVERLLGEGGMGAVYLVERTEGGFRQQGALKRIRSGALSGDLVRRFVRERQILATLDHPCIARLLDGGTTEAGEPWLVMQYVDGRPLYDSCSDAPLSVTGRLKLFLEICSAVQYAHGRLVLHRDLKPGNLLIAADGSPRLLDFGIAKIFADEDERESVDALTLRAPLTPGYASPEQLRGEPVGVTSDVYALGVVLYELLTGVRPYPPTRGATPLALERDPERPSTAAVRPVTEAEESTTTGGRRRLPAPPRDDLRRALSGDLDNIVLRAMHRDPARRYATVEQLAADVRRHLDGFPVLARPDTWSYRAGKYLRRNRLAVTAAAAVLLALVGGLGVSLWQARIAHTERTRAERRLRDVHDLARTMLFEVQDAIVDLPGASKARVLLVRNAAEYLRRLAAESERDTTILRDLAEAYVRLGNLQGRHMMQGVGEPDAALGSFREAVRLRGEVAAMRPQDLPTQEAYAAALHALAAFLIEHQMSKEALDVQGRSLEAQQRIAALQPADTMVTLNAMIMRGNYARALVHTGRFAEGLPLSQRGLVEFPPHVAARPNDARLPVLLAKFHLDYGYLLALASTDPDSARSHLLIALEILDRALKDRPGAAALRMHAAAATGTLSMVEMFGLQRADSAMRYASLSRGIVEAVLHDDPGNAEIENQAAVGRMEEAVLAARTGDFTRAERLESLSAPVAARWGRDSTMREWVATQAHSVRLIEALAAEARAGRVAGADAARAWSEARQKLEACLSELGPEKPEAYEECFLPEQRSDLVRRVANARRRAGG